MGETFMADDDARPLIGWAILELMGHRRLAGYVTEQDVAGHGFLRIDVPGDERVPPATQFYSPSAVYAITPTSETIARATAQLSRPEPVAPWELQRAQLREVPTIVEIERDDFARGRPVDDDDFERCGATYGDPPTYCTKGVDHAAGHVWLVDTLPGQDVEPHDEPTPDPLIPF